MGDRRKLQAEIDRTLKKIDEGVEVFDRIFNKTQARAKGVIDCEATLAPVVPAREQRLERGRDIPSKWMLTPTYVTRFVVDGLLWLSYDRIFNKVQLCGEGCPRRGIVSENKHRAQRGYPARRSFGEDAGITPTRVARFVVEL